MASTVNSVPTNNASGNPSSQNSGRSSLRPKASDSRRQSGSPLETGQRRSNSQKAWTQGTNPITQRASYSQQNGNMSQRGKMSSKESNTADAHAHDRLVFLVTSCIGLHATITMKNGERFSGIFSSSSLEPSETSFVFKMVQRLPKQEQGKTNGASEPATPFLGSAPDHSVSLDARDIVEISVPNVSTSDVTAKAPSGASAGFRTDADISGNLAMRERTLQKWEPAADTDVDLSLESASHSAGWDQFETNARLFGATSSYDENIYTTRIDRSDPAYKEKEAEAARIAREIEGTDVDNAHVREERGVIAAEAGGDEEDKYSGVRRDEKDFPPLLSGQPNKYTPPARRQAGTQPSANANAPVAPAQQPVSTPKDAAPSSGPSRDAAQLPTPVAPSTTGPSAAPEAEQKSAPAKVLPTAAGAPKRAGAENASANVETEVLDHFRQFANSEKMKLQERRRNQASQDRSMKLKELLVFSKSFKLNAPIPKDLVPILAKDPHKQEEILQRAQTGAKNPASSKSSPVPTDRKPANRTPGPGRHDNGATVPPVAAAAPAATAPQADRPGFPRGRQMLPPTGPHAGGRPPHQNMHLGRPATGMLSHRLADNLQQRKGTAPGPVPAPLPINEARLPPTGPAGDLAGAASPSKTHTPTSAASTKFNVRALEFKPNPTASTFTPAASSNSSPFTRGRSVSRATSPAAFFGAKKPRPIAERPSLKDQFNPIKRAKKEVAENPDTKDHYNFNGGIPPAYKTLPTWNVPAGNEEKTYQQMFKAPAMPILSPHRSASNPQAPQPAPMPFPFPQTPGMPPVSGPPHGPHLHPQQHHGSGPPHFDDPHRMQMSASTSQMFPSPRMQQGYPSPMMPHAQIAFGQTMPQMYMNQGGPQAAHMRQYPGAPQFLGPQGAMGGAPMMVQQPSSGPYMGAPQGMAPYTPQMQMYSPNPAQVYPQHGPPSRTAAIPVPAGVPR
ncbi:hypothetical protein P168DRAFT_321922 [Aspergillus campestris IBT 28561]|uniref:LsmAD domain-containing protein n=1 Tax=Aspergillus campestris (strain IBT 28561) TaxID=1392248 RepID=A0A2I1CTA7_ASPC2|nr:uncharacterized protein P168DRAFT_321922 [Aspergillus campestris IBT 28561]PKY00863.1 hypothetical protein P168DRAFT_321922 [Aspergillus campestris IBT 28561]